MTHKSHSLTDELVFGPASLMGYYNKLKHTQALCIQHLTNHDYLLLI